MLADIDGGLRRPVGVRFTPQQDAHALIEANRVVVGETLQLFKIEARQAGRVNELLNRSNSLLSRDRSELLQGTLKRGVNANSSRQ